MELECGGSEVFTLFFKDNKFGGPGTIQQFRRAYLICLPEDVITVQDDNFYFDSVCRYMVITTIEIFYFYLSFQEFVHEII